MTTARGAPGAGRGRKVPLELRREQRCVPWGPDRWHVTAVDAVGPGEDPALLSSPRGRHPGGARRGLRVQTRSGLGLVRVPWGQWARVGQKLPGPPGGGAGVQGQQAGEGPGGGPEPTGRDARRPVHGCEGWRPWLRKADLHVHWSQLERGLCLPRAQRPHTCWASSGCASVRSRDGPRLVVTGSSAVACAHRNHAVTRPLLPLAPQVLAGSPRSHPDVPVCAVLWW